MTPTAPHADIQAIRTVALVGQTGAGKTSLAEALLVKAGMLGVLGRTGVSGDLEGNKTYWGAPAQEASAVKEI